MAKRSNKQSRSKTNRRIQDALQIAEKSERYQKSSRNQGSDDSDTEGAIMNAKRYVQGDYGDDNEEFVDEEIDSDEAFGPDDDFETFKSKGTDKTTAKGKGRGKPSHFEDEDEVDEEEDSEDEEGLVTLSQAWDMDDSEKKKANFAKSTQQLILNDNIDSAESSSEADSSSEEEEEEDPFAEMESYNEDEVELNTVVKDLDDADKNKNRVLINPKDEEDEYKVPTTGHKLSLKQMLEATGDSSISQDNFLLRRKLVDGSESATMAVPLPKRLQQRKEREAAYELSKAEADKWQDTVKSLREAEHLVFPLQPQKDFDEELEEPEAKELKPLTKLETAVNEVLKASSLLDDKKESTFEEMATAKMNPADLRRRQNELRMMRELMFREERKAKRIKKIKSKTYHKIKKKERLRTEQLVEGDESDEEEHDSKRALERMSLKHKTNGQWAKSIIKSGMSKDKSVRDELEETLRQGERLRAKIQGDEDYSDARSISDLESDGEESDPELRSKIGKGVMNMDFMKKAEAKQKAANKEELERLRRFQEYGQEDDLDEFRNESTSANVVLNPGRRVYTPGAALEHKEIEEENVKVLEEHEIDNAKSLTNKLSKTVHREKLKNAEDTVKESESQNEKQSEEENDSTVNPWLTITTNGSTHKSKKVRVVDKDSSKSEKAAAKLTKTKKRSNAHLEEDGPIVDMNERLKIVDPYGSDEDDEDGSNVRMFKQTELIREAFAGDDVIDEFQKEKEATIKADGDKEVDLTLPGWGDWAGSDIKKKRRRKTVKVAGVVSEERRKDRQLNSVIINEKVNKKNLKYRTDKVPYPFETMAQYEQSLRTPLGQEWITRTTHQELITPRVIVSHGAVVDPLDAPFK
ncbi:hypothetical protein LJB42_003378 [Komagataella kurtzmanii]|nr:hypothetical protein LJB42_003378 [Komagataella kurtzmanii]